MLWPIQVTLEPRVQPEGRIYIVLTERHMRTVDDDQHEALLEKARSCLEAVTYQSGANPGVKVFHRFKIGETAFGSPQSGTCHWAR